MSTECPFCKMPFYSKVSEEAHKKLYPGHFSGSAPQQVKEEAIPQVKVTKPKQKAKERKKHA